MESWHALLAPLPAHAHVVVKPVVAPELATEPSMSPIAGWTQLTVELSGGAAGLRHLMVVLDATGHPISAADHVLYCNRTADGSGAEYVHESLGGRIEADGRFNGTYWRMLRTEADDAPESSEEPPFDAQSRPPSADETSALMLLVTNIMLRRETAG